MYFLGFLAAIGTAWLLKRSVLRAPPPPFLLELPPYRRPLAREVLRQVYLRCRVFVTQTGTVILAISLVLWALLSFPRQGLEPEVYEAGLVRAQALEGSERDEALAHLEREDSASQLEHSVAGRIGHLIEPVIEPLGFDWRIGIGLVASFAAREVLVSTLGQVYALDADIDAESPALRDALLADRDPETGEPLFSPLVGLSLMVFFVLAMQCMSTLATVKRETNSWRWPLAQLLYMNTLAYVASLVVYQGGSLLGLG
jgi:ferrous iron transport protein B